MNTDLLRREVVYRMSYRGTLELDTLCRRIMPQVLEMDDEKLVDVRDLLLEKEGDLMAWLVEGETPPERWAATVEWMRDAFKSS